MATLSCPNCSGDLRGVSCKLRCPRCGYFESCSDLEPHPADFEEATGLARTKAGEVAKGREPRRGEDPR